MGSAEDVVELNLKTANDYKDGRVSITKKDQVWVFALGSGYVVNAKLTSGGKPIPEDLGKIFYLGLAWNGEDIHKNIKNAASNMPGMYGRGSSDGRGLDANNLLAFERLLGTNKQSKKYSVDIAYTIAPN